MAQIPDGILGALIGRIGPVSGYRRKGVNIIRKANSNHDGKITSGRLNQREKLKICNAFTQAFSGTKFFEKSFPAYGHTGSGYNRALSNLMTRAITGEYPHQTLLWENILVARGPLPGAEDLVTATDGFGNILFSWTINTDTGSARGNDKMIGVAYCMDLNQALFTLDGGTREMGSGILEASLFTGKSVATYASFINESGDVADSVYGGILGV